MDGPPFSDAAFVVVVAVDIHGFSDPPSLPALRLSSLTGELFSVMEPLAAIVSPEIVLVDSGIGFHKRWTGRDSWFFRRLKSVIFFLCPHRFCTSLLDFFFYNQCFCFTLSKF